MNHNDNSEFIKALLEYEENQMNQSKAVELGSDCQKESFGFTQSMEYLFQNGSLPKGYVSAYKRRERVARMKQVTYLAAILILFCVGFMKKPATAIQMPIINITEDWILERDEVILKPELSSNVKCKDKISVYYGIGWLPKGYYILKEYYDHPYDSYYYIRYRNDSNGHFSFRHTPLEHSNTIQMTRKECKKVIENGIIYYLFSNTAYNILYWADENGQYELSGNVDEKALFKMANSLVEVKPN